MLGWWRDEIDKLTDDRPVWFVKAFTIALVANLFWTGWRTAQARTTAGLIFQILCLVGAVIGLHAHALAWTRIARRSRLVAAPAPFPIPVGIPPRVRIADQTTSV